GRQGLRARAARVARRGRSREPQRPAERPEKPEEAAGMSQSRRREAVPCRWLEWSTECEAAVRGSAYAATIMPPGGVRVRQVRGPVFVAPEAEVCQDATDDAGIFDRGDQAHP